MKKTLFAATFSFAILTSTFSWAQEQEREQEQETVREQKYKSQEIQTVFRRSGNSSGGYGAITNKFTTINGQYANMAGIYGGWYVNHWFMIGVAFSGLTNNFPVPLQYSADPSIDLSYGYGQFGLMTEYVVGSRKAVHATFSLFSGAGFTVQYQRHDWNNDDIHTHAYDDDWFFVAEPGVALELNVFRWMRFSPGVSYRATMGSNAAGLSDGGLSNFSYNATLKFGRF